MSDMQVETSSFEEAILNKRNQRVDDGVIVRVVGPVVDVKFDGPVPSIYTALTVEDDTLVTSAPSLRLSLSFTVVLFVPSLCRQPMVFSVIFALRTPASQ